MLPIVDFTLDDSASGLHLCGAFFPSSGNTGRAVFEVDYDIGTQSFCPQAVSDGFNAVRQNATSTVDGGPCGSIGRGAPH